MPAMHYRLRWPDHAETTCYSPSLVIKDYFEPGRTYPLTEFLRRVREATRIASARVYEKYGFECSRANDQLLAIEGRAVGFAGRAGAQVEVLSFDENVAG